MRLANEGPGEVRRGGESKANRLSLGRLAFVRADYCAQLGLNSALEILKGFGGSNPLLSAIQSTIFALSAEKSKIVRTLRIFLGPEGTGEDQIRASVADLCMILSVENRAGAL